MECMSCHLFYGIVLRHLHCRCSATRDSSNPLTDVVLHKDYFAAVYLSGAAVGLKRYECFSGTCFASPNSRS